MCSPLNNFIYFNNGFIYFNNFLLWVSRLNCNLIKNNRETLVSFYYSVCILHEEMLGNLGTALYYNHPQQRILVAAEFFI